MSFLLGIATSSIDCTIRVWDPVTGMPLFSTIDAGPVDSWAVSEFSCKLCWSLLLCLLQVALTPDGVRLATGSQGGKVHLYNVESGTKEATFETGGKFILSLCYVSFSVTTCFPVALITLSRFQSPDGAHLAVGSQDGGIYVFDLETGSNVHAEGEDVSSTRGMLKQTRLCFKPTQCRFGH